ncbi:energy-coupling factor transporter ATPase [Fructilactobacillus carniphilus]|uniref:Energy-coupling factor transporter ATPase n=1 Tax=Fructilactobacillus carniphilus TaxID=2940297 RepID=A0ABY5BXW7_9LACO|nr:energy-coupling factor transporter ATPase [Fructilactobacillus carniphilus]USS90788.1 energy-coupling factor transporter ATPase [Fructilactobacillus carniphilus]
MQPKIEFQDVDFSYQPEVPVLKHVSFQVQPGQTVALVGANGSGKSTIAKLLTGLLTPNHGSILVDQITLTPQNMAELRQRIGLVFQNPDDQIVGATVAENTAFGLENRNVPRPEMQRRVQTALEQVEMWEYRDREPGLLSGGQKQRVALASALAITPEILILDEATSMLDPQAKQELNQIIQRLQQQAGLTIILITHDLEMLALAERVIALDQQQVAFTGTAAELFRQEDLLMRMQLELPFSLQVQRDLAAQQVPLPATDLNEKELIVWLTKLL